MGVGILFADVRGLTSLAETETPDAVAKLLNRFYAPAAMSSVTTRSSTSSSATR
jgi:hypothetical protein